jgi:hypothetical protein
MKTRKATLALLLVLGIGACGDTPLAPEAAPPDGLVPSAQKKVNGTGLVLESLTGVSAPIVGQLAEVVIDQAVITELFLVEDIVSGVIGLEAEGVLQLTGGVLGTDVVTQNFRTEVDVTSSGPGKCSLLTVDLGPIAVNALNLAEVDAPVATVDARGSGAVGSLLCNLGNLLSGVVGGATRGVQGLVNAINRVI